MAVLNEIENGEEDDDDDHDDDNSSDPLVDINDDELTTSLTTSLTKSLAKSLASPTVTSNKRPATPQSLTSNHSSSVNNRMSSLDGYSTNSNPYADSINSNNSINNNNNNDTSNNFGSPSQTNSKTMEVTVTVLSLHGILAKKNNSIIKKQKKLQKKKLKKQRGKQQQQHHRQGGATGRQHAEIDRPTASIVASFSQNISQERVFLTHVPSLPVSLLLRASTTNPATSGTRPSPSSSTAVYGSSHAPPSPGCRSTGIDANGGKKSPKSPGRGGGGGGSGNGNNGGNEMIRPVVHWSSMDTTDIEAGNALSTLQFRRKFVREGPAATAAADNNNNNNININNNAANRYVPQTCPINLSISRNGKMALLGKVDLIINGEERGRTSVTVPIARSGGVRRSSKSAAAVNPVARVKKIRNLKKQINSGTGIGGGKSSSSSSSDTYNNENGNNDGNADNTPMVRIKGDAYHFGLEGGAMLRMIVHVHDPDEDAVLDIPEDEEMNYYRRNATATAYGNGDDEDDSVSDDESNDSISDNEGAMSVEGDDPSILERDDYFNSLAMNNSELHTLRSQLARSEQTNGILQMELANAQYSAQCGMQHQYEKEHLALQLQMASQNTALLQRELNVAKGESEALPIYERRVTELLDDLRKRDGEVGQLQEELERRDVEVECLREEIGQLNRRYKRQLVDSLLWDAHDGGGGRDAAVANNSVEANGRKSGEEQRADSPAAEGGEGMLNKWLSGKTLANAVSSEEKSNDEWDEAPSSRGAEETLDEAAAAAPPSKAKRDDASPEPSGDDGAVAIGPTIDEIDEELGEREEANEDGAEENAHGDGSFSLAAVLTPPRKKKARKDLIPEDDDDGVDDGVLGGEKATLEATMADDDEFVYASWKQVGTTSGGGGASSKTMDGYNEPWALKEGTFEASSQATYSNNGDDEDENAFSSKQARGWGIRGLGASLLSMEERMRERQQLFQEQQQRELEKAQREAAAVASSKGLGDVLMSRFSNHGGRIGGASGPPSPPGTSVGSLEENAEETDEELAEIEKASSGHVGGSIEGEDGDGNATDGGVPSPSSSFDCTEDTGDDGKDRETIIAAVEEDEKVVTIGEADDAKTVADTVPEEGVTEDGLEPRMVPFSMDKSDQGDAQDTLPAEGAGVAEDEASSTPSEDASEGLIPITPAILEVASFLWDGAESTDGSGGDENDRREVVGVDSDGSAIEADGVPNEEGVEILDANPVVAEVEERSTKQNEENGGKAATVGENAIVSSTDNSAENTPQSTKNNEDRGEEVNQDVPCASDGTSQFEKEPDSLKEEPRDMHSKAVEAEGDASPERPMASVSNTAIADDISSEESGEGAAAVETPPSSEDPDGNMPKKRRWGVRGLGARLKGMEGKMKERSRLFREQQQREFEEAERQRAKDAAAAANQLGLGGALISRISTHGSNPVTAATSPVSDEILVEECAEEDGDEIVEEQKEDSSTLQSCGANDDEERLAKLEDPTLLMVDDSLDDVLTEEARQHRAKTNQALLLQSMDMLEDELMSGIINNVTEAVTTDDAVSKENASRTLSTDCPPNEISEEPAPSKNVYASASSEEEDGDVSTGKADNAGLTFHALTKAMDKSVREIVEEIEETLSTPSKGAIDNDDELVASFLECTDDDTNECGQALSEESADEAKQHLTYEGSKDMEQATVKQDHCPLETHEKESRDENCTSTSSCDEEAGCDLSSSNSPDANMIDVGKDRITFDSPRSVTAPLTNN